MKFLVGARSRMRRTLLSFDACITTALRFAPTILRADCSVCRQRTSLPCGRPRAISLCGRNSVQIHERHRPIQFSDLETRLAPHGEVRYTEYVLKFLRSPYELTLFPDDAQSSKAPPMSASPAASTPVHRLLDTRSGAPFLPLLAEVWLLTLFFSTELTRAVLPPHSPEAKPNRLRNPAPAANSSATSPPPPRVRRRIAKELLYAHQVVSRGDHAGSSLPSFCICCNPMSASRQLHRHLRPTVSSNTPPLAM